MTLKILGRTVGPLVLVAAALTAVQPRCGPGSGTAATSAWTTTFYTRAAQLPPPVQQRPAAYNGHLMPGGMIWAWLVTRAAP